MHGGIERFSEPMLEAYRAAVVDEFLGPELEAALAPLRKGRRYEIGGGADAGGAARGGSGE